MSKLKDLVCLELDQKDLKLNFSDCLLEKLWNSHWLINNLREEIAPLVEAKLQESEFSFDPQDLEHQALFFLTTYNPGEITSEVIKDAVDSQYLIIKDRLLKVMTKEELKYLFRGLKFFYPDLNARYRLTLHKGENGQLYASGDGRNFEVEFKKIEDKNIISCFTGGLHYIHQERTKGDTFGFFFKGDKYPWAVETTERSTNSKGYKRDSLLAHGINPDCAIELTRLYTLPGSPMNAISLIDKMVKKYYLEKGDVEALFTCTMPSYSKSKSTTIAGGINKTLCMRDGIHYFVKREIEGKTCYEAVTKRWIEQNKEAELITTHPNFKLLPVIDVYMTIKETSLDPLPEIKEGKVIYFKD